MTGRIKHFISAFGEHVIGEEVEAALQMALQKHPAKITEFTVAPMIQQGEGKSYHEWCIEFETPPSDMAAFAASLNEGLSNKNVYYQDLMQGNILLPLQIRPVQKNGFIQYMKLEGKLGGQNKVPRLSNDRKIAEGLQQFLHA